MNRQDKFEAILDESGFSSGAGVLKKGAAIDFDNTDYKSMLEAVGYKINNKYFGELKELFSKDYERFDFNYDRNRIIYSGAEHTGKPKLPNITVLPNLQATKGITVLGSTMGHQHTQLETGDARQFQEIYEFYSHGAMLLRNTCRKDARLHLLRPREKIGVRTNDHMTIFNLGTQPLITLDYANPDKNRAQKDLEKEKGTLITIAHQETKNSPDTTFYFNSNYGSSRRPIEVAYANLGEPLFERMRAYKTEFKNNGIELFFGSNLSDRQRKELQEPLADLVLKRDKILLRELMVKD